MLTAILVLTALVIAVIALALCKVSSKCSRIEEQESIKWARKWNEQRAKDICDSDCLWCGNEQFCKLKDAQ
jgi:hypothetical protein